MPTYEFRCRSCGQTFTEGRSMAQSSDPATCPSGHTDTVRLLDFAGMSRGGSQVSAVRAPSAGSGAGGCCGGGCCS